MLVPIVAALVTKNGFDAATVLVGVGTLYVAAGLWFRVPIPVQPIKAAAAIAIAKGLAPATLSTAGILLGFTLAVAGATRLSAILDRLFTKPVIRGVQLGVGLILVKTALHIDAHPTALTFLVAAAVAGAVIAAQRFPQVPVVLIAVGGGVAVSLLGGGMLTVRTGVWHPHLLHGIGISTVASAFVLLVVPQIPLTFGNAVVALSELEHRYFGETARRVTPTSASLSCGFANMAMGSLGGMPMCHGSGGLTAHYRAGARTARMNAVIGATLLVIGLAFGPTALALFGLIPGEVLMGLLAFTGLMHAALILDLRGFDLGVAVLMGAVGLVTANLALALALGLAAIWTRRGVSRVKVGT